MICWDALTLTQKHCSHADSAWCNATYITFALGLGFEKKKTNLSFTVWNPRSIYKKWLRLDQQYRVQNGLLTKRPPARSLTLHADGVFWTCSLFECLQFKIMQAALAMEISRRKMQLWKTDLICFLFWHSTPEAEIRLSLPWRRDIYFETLLNLYWSYTCSNKIL